jgi:Smg protein
MSKDTTILDVLLHISKHYNKTNAWINKSSKLIDDLQKKGFDPKLINQSLDWLAALTNAKVHLETMPSDRSTFRIFSKEEQCYFSSTGINFILSLQSHGVLNTLTRELVIQQALLLQLETITIPVIKGVVALVLFIDELNTSDKLKKLNFLLLQEDDSSGGCH